VYDELAITKYITKYSGVVVLVDAFVHTMCRLSTPQVRFYACGHVICL
jgi:hypothetical protein